ncbi:MAG: hypothetical protein A2600_07875 [Candidatus Lambdaproteobacteria bacterium RIFOXYD1_FULL_56_27]|nr:MAG: hypothetical protein A2426_09830 [Candidatus Lambdaproteobacteria bacterium RIFOXYC1_FULL_56_13]OGH09691.1 MAG: hypothetical protein A2600_07875 [Candidatus Lambdaproteobacteria bacterium RIFOXYD1_FULL_56_27]
MRTILRLVAKFLFLGLILGYLIYSGHLNPGKLFLFTEMPLFFGLMFANVALGMLGLNAVRWWVLLKSLSIHLMFRRVLAITMISFFFNISMPGTIAQDAIRSLYILKEKEKTSQTVPLVMSVILDRFLGFFGVILSFLAGVLWLPEELNINPIIYYTVWTVGFCSFCGIFTISIFVLPLSEIDQFIVILARVPIIGSHLIQIALALRAYKGKWGVLSIAMGLSILTQVIFVFVMTVGYQLLTRQSLPFSVHMFVVPIGELATILPLTPAGAGIGHVSYDYLYHMFGGKMGADLFNLYFCMVLLVGSIGGLPYLLIKPKKMNKEDLLTTSQ